MTHYLFFENVSSAFVTGGGEIVIPSSYLNPIMHVPPYPSSKSDKVSPRQWTIVCQIINLSTSLVNSPTIGLPVELNDRVA